MFGYRDIGPAMTIYRTVHIAAVDGTVRKQHTLTEPGYDGSTIGNHAVAPIL